MMTTLVALATKDALVMGCDSLGSVTWEFVDPYNLIQPFFDADNEFKLSLDENGEPNLKSFGQIIERAQRVPFNHMPNMTKMFSLHPRHVGVMTTGISSIGNRTIKSLVRQFKETDDLFRYDEDSANYTVHSVSEKLLSFIKKYYEEEYTSPQIRPGLEIMVGGYDKSEHLPSIYRIIAVQNILRSVFSEA